MISECEVVILRNGLVTDQEKKNDTNVYVNAAPVHAQKKGNCSVQKKNNASFN